MAADAVVRKDPERKQTTMKNLLLHLKLWKDQHGQDLIEYALMAGFVAVAAGAVMPNVTSQINKIFNKVVSILTAAAAQ